MQDIGAYSTMLIARDEMSSSMVTGPQRVVEADEAAVDAVLTPAQRYHDSFATGHGAGD